ncbi:hypothetical protein [Bradymonas sediminis]|nr:hypothetical protein [Bradymonas sediminis]TDP77613.1 septation ring formation regulator EzrA [Bradymonas sediminis]
MLIRRLILTLSLALLASFLAPSLALSADWDRFPELKPREHFAIKRLYDGPKYKDLRECYRRFDSRVGADYFGAMVEVTAESGSRSRKEDNAVPYANALYDAWKADGILDDRDDILVVFGLRNRSIAIRPGAKWQKLGFDGETIAKTIEASHFDKFHKRRKYSDALCSVLTAVDLRLVTLQQQMEKDVAAIEERLPTVDAELSALHKKVSARFAKLPNKDHPFGQKLLAKLAAARTHLTEATERAKDAPTDAVRLADKAEAVLQPVRDELKIFNQDMEQLDSVAAEIATLKSTLLARDDVDEDYPKRALLQVQECEKLTQQIREKYEGNPAQLSDCRRLVDEHLAQADVEVARAEVHDYYLKTLLPLLALMLLILGAIAVVFLQTLRRRRALAQLQPDLVEWENRLANAAKSQQELELKAPTYFAPGRASWTGESAAIDERLGEYGARVDALLLQGNQLLAQAKQLQAKSHPLDAKRLEDALTLLRNTPLDAVASAADGATASQLLGNLADAQREALGALDDLLATRARHDEEAARAAAAVSRAEQAVQKRRDLGLPAEYLLTGLESATAAWQDAVNRGDQDPKAAADTYARITPQLTDIAERAEAGNHAIEAIRGDLSDTAEALRQRIKQLRFSGVDIDKLRFAPEQDLSAARREASRIVEALADGEDKSVGDAAQQLRANLEQLSRRLEIVAVAKEKIPQRIQNLSSRGDTLKERLMDLRYALKSLATQGNPNVYQASSAQVGRYQSQLDRLGRELSKAKEDHRLKRFLSATERLDSATRLVEKAEELVQQLGTLETTIGVTQAKCEQLLKTCNADCDALLKKAQEPGIDPDLRALIAQAHDALETLNAQAENEQIDWFEARTQLDSLQKSLLFLGAQADADRNAFTQAQQLLQQVQQDFGAASNGLARADYAGIIANAQNLLDGWRQQMQEGAGGGALLRTGHAVAAACARALKLAKSPRSLADNAHQQLAHANARHAQIHDAPYGYEVTGDCTQAGADLRAAAEQIERADFANALASAEAATVQIELEDARARALAARNYRRAQLKNLASATDAPNLEAFGPRRSTSGPHAAAREPSSAEA